MSYVFISYSSQNAEQAMAINGILKSKDIQTWIAPDDIPIGEKYASVINKAIKNCDCMLLILTEDAQNSVWVAKEVERAINGKKMIIPIKLEKLSLNDEFELYLSTDQIVFLPEISEECKEMQAIIKVLLSNVGKHNTPVTAATPVTDAPPVTDATALPQVPLSPIAAPSETIRNYVKRVFKHLLEKRLLSEDELTRLYEKEYSKKTFGIAFPAFAKGEQFLEISGHARYWKKPIEGYYICSQWRKAYDAEYEKKIALWLERVFPDYKNYGLERR